MCGFCHCFGHNKKTCSRKKEKLLLQKEASAERRAKLKALFEKSGFAPGAIVGVSVNAQGINGAPATMCLIPAMVLSMEDMSADRGLLSYGFRVQKFGKLEDYPGIGTYHRFGKEDEGTVSIPVELEQKYERDHNSIVGSYSSTKLLVPVEPGPTFSQFYDEKFMAGE